MPSALHRNIDGGDFVSLHTFLPFTRKSALLFLCYQAYKQDCLHKKKNRKVCNKTRSPPASFLFEDLGTEHTTENSPAA